MYHHPVITILLLSFVAGCVGTGGQQLAGNSSQTIDRTTAEAPIQSGSRSADAHSVTLASFQDESSEAAAKTDSVEVVAKDFGDQKAGLDSKVAAEADFSSDLKALAVPESSVGAETLYEAWAIAVSVNQRLQAKKNETGAATFTHEAAKSARLPSVRTISGYTVLDKEPGVNVSLFGSLPIADQQFFASSTMATLPIYTHGKISSAIDASCSSVNASRFDERSETQDLKMQVAEAYVSVLQTQRLIEVADRSVETLAAHLMDVEDLFEKGVVAKSDVLAVKVAHANAREKQLKARNGLDLASAAYNRLMGRQLAQPVLVAELADNLEPLHDDVDGLVGMAIGQRPELQSVAHKSRALRHQADLERSETGPQVGLVGGFHYLEDSNLAHNDLWSMTLAAEWKLFDGGMARSKAAAMEQRASAVTRLQKDLQSRIALQVRQAWLSLQNATERIEVAEMSVEQAEENLKVTLDRYRKEVGTNTEVLDAQTLLTSSRSNYYSAVYEAALARIMLDRAVGNL